MIVDLAFQPRAGPPVLLTATANGVVRCWDVGEKPPRELPAPLKEHLGPVRHLAFSPDERSLISGGGDGTVRSWDLLTGGPSRLRHTHPERPIGALAVHPYGQWVASTGRYESHVSLLCMDQRRQDVSVDTDVQALAFHPEGLYLAIATSSGLARLELTNWRLDSAQTVKGNLSAVAYAPDGKSLAYGGVNVLGRSRTLDLVPLSLSEAVANSFQNTSVSAVAFTADGNRLVVNAGGTVRLVDLSAGKVGMSMLGQVRGVSVQALSPDGERLALIDDSGQLTVLNPGKPNGGEPIHVAMTKPGRVRALCFAPDSRHLAAGNGNGAIYILRLGGPGD
jgi:WD40 repeat protein